MSYGINAPQGAQARKHINGSTWNGAVETYTVQDSYATNLFTGDFVYLAAGYMIVASVNGPITGVFQGCVYTTAGSVVTFSPYWPASTATFATAGAQAFVCIDPTVQYDMQFNAGSLTQAMIGNNAKFVANAGSTVTGQSAFAIDNATVGTGNSTYPLKIQSLVPVPGNTYGLTYNNAYVTINNDQFQGGTGTTGV